MTTIEIGVEASVVALHSSFRRRGVNGRGLVMIRLTSETGDDGSSSKVR